MAKSRGGVVPTRLVLVALGDGGGFGLDCLLRINQIVRSMSRVLERLIVDETYLKQSHIRPVPSRK